MFWEEDEIAKIDAEHLYIGELNMDTVLSHYNAISILIDSAKKNGDHTALQKWDKARNRNSSHTLSIKP